MDIPNNIEIFDEDYFNEVVEHAKKIGMERQLQETLHWLSKVTLGGYGEYGIASLSRDFAPYSFHGMWLVVRNGRRLIRGNFGLIYHGKTEEEVVGNLTVTLTPTKGWQIHT